MPCVFQEKQYFQIFDLFAVRKIRSHTKSGPDQVQSALHSLQGLYEKSTVFASLDRFASNSVRELQFKMVDSVISLATLIAIDLIIFVVVLLVFLCTRSKRNTAYDDPPEEYKAPPSPIEDESQLSCGEVCKRVYKVTDDELIEKTNAETLLFLKLEKRLGIMLLIFAVLGCGVLLPVYLLGSGD
jgi:hypothetical protein